MQENQHRSAVYVYPWCVLWPSFIPFVAFPWPISSPLWTISRFLLLAQSRLSLHWLNEVDHSRHVFDTAAKGEFAYSRLLPAGVAAFAASGGHVNEHTSLTGETSLLFYDGLDS